MWTPVISLISFLWPKNLKSDASILLDAGIPKALWGVNPRTILGDTWWQYEREAAIATAGNKCEVCGISADQAKYHQRLEGHERYILDIPKCTATYDRTYALCHSCHMYIHRGRMSYLVRTGRESAEKRKSIIQHGEGLLKLERLPLPDDDALDEAPDDLPWKLVIHGHSYTKPEPI